LKSCSTLLVCLALLLPCQGWAVPDKEKHVIVSAGLTTLAYAGARRSNFSHGQSVAISATSVFLLGLFKEYAMDDQPDLKDVGANAAGIGIGLLIPLIVRF
jgi:branched-subunit amino acid ABC-type transport system permease component